MCAHQKRTLLSAHTMHNMLPRRSTYRHAARTDNDNDDEESTYRHAARTDNDDDDDDDEPVGSERQRRDGVRHSRQLNGRRRRLLGRRERGDDDALFAVGRRNRRHERLCDCAVGAAGRRDARAADAERHDVSAVCAARGRWRAIGGAPTSAHRAPR